MENDNWFSDEETILDEIRNAQPTGFGVEIPGYSQITEIARGGQATVYRAIQDGTQRSVAIKVMYPDFADVTIQQTRFTREIELVGSLDHQFIVRIYDGGILENGQLFTVMEFVDGKQLNRYLKSANLQIVSMIRLFLRICDGVGFAHRRGVMHRDLKPSNILVTEDGNPHIVDFGIARAIGENTSSTFTGQFIGTLAYASPEQIAASPNAIDSRTDVYSLGVILYRMVTGSTPYPVDGAIGETVRAIQHSIPTTPSKMNANGDGDLDAIILKCLEKQPNLRYQSVDSLSMDLQRYLDGEAIEAKRDQTWYLLGKIIRRHRMKFIGAVAALLMLFSFSIFVTSLYRRVVTEEQKTSEIKVFWEDTLGSVTPAQTDKPVTFDEVLGEAVHWVDLTTKDQPEVEAALRATIGNGYRNIGRFDLAEIELQKSLEIHNRIHGPDHPDLIQSLNSIALLRKSEGKPDQAREIFMQTLKAREKTLGKNHPDVAMSLQNLGRLEMETGNLNEADSHFQRALKIRERHFKYDDPAVATVLFNQADLASLKGDWITAEDLHTKALFVRRKRLPETHPDVARSLLALSRVYQYISEPNKARTLAEEALNLRKQVMSDDHQLVREVEALLEEIGKPEPPFEKPPGAARFQN